MTNPCKYGHYAHISLFANLEDPGQIIISKCSDQSYLCSHMQKRDVRKTFEQKYSLISIHFTLSQLLKHIRCTIIVYKFKASPYTNCIINSVFQISRYSYESH